MSIFLIILGLVHASTTSHIFRIFITNSIYFQNNYLVPSFFSPLVILSAFVCWLIVKRYKKTLSFIISFLLLTYFFTLITPQLIKMNLVSTSGVSSKLLLYYFILGGGFVLGHIIPKRYRNKVIYKNELKKIIDFSNSNKEYVYIDIPKVKKRIYGFEFSQNDQEFQSQSLKNCDVLVTNFSTLMLEATIFDKPIINVGFDMARQGRLVKNSENAVKCKHIKNVIKNGFAPIAYTKNELLELLNEYLADPKKDSSKRKEIYDKFLSINPGNSGRVIGQQIIELL